MLDERNLTQTDGVLKALQPAIVKIGINLGIFTALSESNGSLTVEELASRRRADPTVLGEL